jgi:hypothetical protein
MAWPVSEYLRLSPSVAIFHICLTSLMDWKSYFITCWTTKWIMGAEQVKARIRKHEPNPYSQPSLLSSKPHFPPRITSRLLYNAHGKLSSDQDLFEQALKLDSLKTAVGYLLVLQAFEDEEQGHDGRIEEYVVRLIALASQKGDWELCAELARFLIALDASGEMLRRAISRVGLRSDSQAAMKGAFPGSASRFGPAGVQGLGLNLPIRSPSWASLSPTSPLSPRASRQDGDVSDEHSSAD